MKVGIEATSLLGPRSGVGHSTASLVEALVEIDPSLEIVLLPLSLRGAGRLARVAPSHPRITSLGLRVPARVAHGAWKRLNWPPAELLCGAVDVFHGPNFLLPPVVKAAGVLTVHDLAFVRVPETCSPAVRAYARSVPVSARRADRIVVPSSFTRDEIADWLPDVADRVRVVPMGVRPGFAGPGGPLAPTRRAELGLRDPYLAFVGNVEARKNVGLLLDAFAEARVRQPGVQLVLAGSPGQGWDEIAARHAALVGSSAVVVAGYLPDPEIAALVRGARAFVYPSRYEGFGMPPLEAMAAGTPVIATDTAALPETLGGHARLVAPGDGDALAKALVDAIETPPDAEAVDAARAWARSFTWERTARGTLQVYREALGVS